VKNHVLFCLVFWYTLAYSQTIENADFHAEGKTIVVTYDLIGCASDEKYAVSLAFVGETGEKVIPKTLSGDLSNITCGSKKIVWDILKDRNSFEGKYQVQVSVLPATNLPATKTVKDIDGNIYNTVQIGDEVWFAENLRTTKYNDGTLIPNVTDANAWKNVTTGAYCFYDNKPENDAICGNLYNWYAVDTKKLCPTGWHVPSDEEWAALEHYLGEAAGKKMKSITGWYNNGNGTNESGFSALPGGYRDGNGTFYGVGSGGLWWSSTEYGARDAWLRSLGYFNVVVGRFGSFGKESGVSVRCLRD
jgi:uncharacterized protein (TIGR02145 family)